MSTSPTYVFIPERKQYHYRVQLTKIGVCVEIIRIGESTPETVIMRGFPATNFMGDFAPHSVTAALERATKWALDVIKALENGERL